MLLHFDHRTMYSCNLPLANGIKCRTLLLYQRWNRIKQHRMEKPYYNCHWKWYQLFVVFVFFFFGFKYFCLNLSIVKLADIDTTFTAPNSTTIIEFCVIATADILQFWLFVETTRSVISICMALVLNLFARILYVHFDFWFYYQKFSCNNNGCIRQCTIFHAQKIQLSNFNKNLWYACASSWLWRDSNRML